MDELEIAGQRYLSTRRAGKEHKYHSDYIGQLIRGGKVVGKKVGRSWYVEEASLNAYLSGEDQRSKPIVKKAPEPLVAKVAVEPVAEVVAEQKPEPALVNVIEEKVEAPAAVEKTEPVKIVAEKHFNPEPVRRIPVDEGNKIPIKAAQTSSVKTAGLTYISDDTPSLPEVPSKKVSITVSEEVPTYVSEYLPTVEEVQKGKIGTLSFVALAVVGILTFSITAAASVAISFETTVAGGQVAGVGYTLK